MIKPRIWKETIKIYFNLKFLKREIKFINPLLPDGTYKYQKTLKYI